MTVPRVTFVLGTRPEAIKLATLIIAFKKSKKVKVRIILTGQHKEMVSQVMEFFNLKADKDLNLMKSKQTLSHITNKVISGISDELKENKSDLLIVQGDTSSAFSAAMAAFYSNVPIGHVEAGLRSNELYDPYPEEANRRLISQISELHFAPTKLSKTNLIKNGITKNIFITGNTVIDALLKVSSKVKKYTNENYNSEKQTLILTTIHRRENWGERLNNIIKALSILLEEFKDLVFLIPLHKNKIVRDPIIKFLGKQKRVLLVEPLNYNELVSVMKESKFLLTDSGGLQEEAPALGKPVLVLRDTTERPEAINSGTAKLIGVETENIVKYSKQLLNDEILYSSMSQARNPFGDGNSSEIIMKHCLNFLENKKLKL